MVEAMFIHEYDGTEYPQQGCGFAGAGAYNLEVRVETGAGRWCCIHARTESKVAPDSMAAELLRASAVLFSRRSRAVLGALNETAALLSPQDGGGTPRLPPTPRGHGIHNHVAPDSTHPDDGCVGSTHHSSCNVLFPGFPETKCVAIPNTSPKKWSCEHDESDPGE